jgi:hypothetical protein
LEDYLAMSNDETKPARRGRNDESSPNDEARTTKSKFSASRYQLSTFVIEASFVILASSFGLYSATPIASRCSRRA